MSKSGSILVVGSLHYDIMVNTPSLPEVDETVLGSEVYFKCGGKGGNQAVAARQNGANVRFAGALGRDFFADVLLKNLAAADVDTLGVQRIDGATSGMSVALNLPAGDYGAVVASGANLEFDPRQLSFEPPIDLLLLQNELAPDVNLKVAQRAKQENAKVILNAAPMRQLDHKLLDLCDVLIVNRGEAEAIFQETIANPEIAISLLDSEWTSASSIIVTLGGQGSVTKTATQDATWFPAYNVDLFSTHGAGDVFVGAFAAQVTKGNNWSAAVDYASAAAALHVSDRARGLNSINPDTVRAFVRSGHK